MKSILIVDDEEDVRRLAALILREAGYAVSEAGNGAEAMAMVARQACDLVVLDLVMPEMEGAETVMELRRLRPSLPVLAISGVVGADFYLHAARLLGAGATLRKPFTARDLLGHVDALLARSN